MEPLIKLALTGIKSIPGVHSGYQLSVSLRSNPFNFLFSFLRQSGEYKTKWETFKKTVFSASDSFQHPFRIPYMYLYV